jgi:hypothetical protein
MKNPAIYNKKAPMPLDLLVKDIFKRFVAFRDEVVLNWRHELANGLINQRGFQDFDDLRTEITKDGDLIYRIKPVVGFEVKDEFKFYMDFFNAYRKACKEIIDAIENYIRFGPQIEPISCFLSEFNPATLKKKVDPAWKPESWEVKAAKTPIHKLIMALKFMTVLMRNEELDEHNLRPFISFIETKDNLWIAVIDEIVTNSTIASGVSIEFAEGKAHFYEYPDDMLVGAFYRYVHKYIKPPVRLTMPAVSSFTTVRPQNTSKEDELWLTQSNHDGDVAENIPDHGHTPDHE